MLIRPKLTATLLYVLVAIAAALCQFVHAARQVNRVGVGCKPSSCGALTNISSPFRLKGNPPHCGSPFLELSCENNRTILQDGYYRGFYVQQIFYDSGTIRLVDGSLDSDQCSILPKSLVCGSIVDVMYFVSCQVPINSSLYVDASACFNASFSPYPYLFALFSGETPNATGFHESCTVVIQVPRPARLQYFPHNLSILDIHQELLLGYDLPWDCTYWCPDQSICYPDKVSLAKILRRLKIILWNYVNSFRIFFSYGIPSRDTTTLYYTSRTQVAFLIITGVIIIIRTLLGFSCLIGVVIYKFRRRHLSMDDAIEEFLQMHKNLMPIRYSYSEIKAMTQNFKDKLGQGGFGSVFKGKLRSDRLVAVKLLGMSKSKGQDFINEVATIGRIHHINVVQLVGFCVEGSKQALVYDFMPNGSLDKIIFSTEKDINLSWAKVFEIAIGVARGIEYLHRGCDMQILHFDIKPHNILIDENFIPKISDFGLAKLYAVYAVNNSIVSLTAARGTLGYMAPELFYKNIGNISHKADVYSFGMLLMEMVGKRRNLNAHAEESSQTYFPSWIYDRFDNEQDLELGDASEDEKKIVRKMIIVAFWCIQLKPIDRPSISKVLEMLEGEIELLEIPPKPFLLSLESSTGVSEEEPLTSCVTTKSIEMSPM